MARVSMRNGYRVNLSLTLPASPSLPSSVEALGRPSQRSPLFWHPWLCVEKLNLLRTKAEISLK